MNERSIRLLTGADPEHKHGWRYESTCAGCGEKWLSVTKTYAVKRLDKHIRFKCKSPPTEGLAAVLKI